MDHFCLKVKFSYIDFHSRRLYGGLDLIGPRNRRRTMGLGRLKRAIKAETDTATLRRMLAVNAFRTKTKKEKMTKMKAYESTADEHLISVTTVRNYVRNFRKKGIVGLYRKSGSGRLHTYDRALIKKAIGLIKKNGGRITPRKLINKVYELCGRRMSRRQALRILHELGLTGKKAERAHVAAAKPHTVYYWRKVVLPQILALKKEGYTVAIEDEMVVYQDACGNLTYWSPPGEAVKVPYMGDHSKRVALGLTTEPDKNGNVLHCNVMHKAANTKGFIKLLKKAVKMFGLIVVIVDNASWHKSDELKDFLCTMENSIVVFHLPKGSSYLSLQEANWRQTKLSEFYGEYYSSIAKKSQKVLRYLNKKLNPRLDLWKYLLRSPYAYRRGMKRRKNLHEKEGAFQYIVRKYGDLPISKSKKYAPLFADPAHIKKSA